MKRITKLGLIALAITAVTVLSAVSIFALKSKYGVKVGDLNEDGFVDETDAVIMGRYLAKWDDIYPEEESGDLDFDGDITEDDFVILGRFLAGWKQDNKFGKAMVYYKQRFAFLGDSITCGVGASSNGNRYSSVLCKMLEASENNQAISGSVACIDADSPCQSDLVNLTKLGNNIVPPDVVIVALGINDFDMSLGVEFYGPGERGKEEKDVKTFYGALEYTCEYLTNVKKNYNPNLRVIFLTPTIASPEACTGGPYTYDNSAKNKFGCIRRDYCDIILDVAYEYGFEAIDTNKISGIYYHSEDDETCSLYLNDGLHPNDKGHAKLADTILAYLLGEIENAATPIDE